jgi:hypothetical protein
VPDPPLQRAQIALRRKAQHARDALHARLEGPFEAPAEAKRLDGQPLNLAIAHQLHGLRVLKQPEQTILESAHRRGPDQPITA